MGYNWSKVSVITGMVYIDILSNICLVYGSWMWQLIQQSSSGVGQKVTASQKLEETFAKWQDNWDFLHKEQYIQTVIKLQI